VLIRHGQDKQGRQRLGALDLMATAGPGSGGGGGVDVEVDWMQSGRASGDFARGDVLNHFDAKNEIKSKW